MNARNPIPYCLSHLEQLTSAVRRAALEEADRAIDHPAPKNNGEYGRGLIAFRERAREAIRGLMGEAPYVGPARDGIEAQHGLNDTYPGDPYP